MFYGVDKLFLVFGCCVYFVFVGFLLMVLYMGRYNWLRFKWIYNYYIFIIYFYVLNEVRIMCIGRF